MASEVEALPPAKDPLLDSSAAGEAETPLYASLRRLEAFLGLLGFHGSHGSSSIRLVASCAAFLLLSVAVPSASLYLSRCSGSGCQRYQIERLDAIVLAFEAALAAVSLACVSWNLHKYGIRRFLFVDQYHGETGRFQEAYASKIQDFFSLLLWWILPCLIVKTTREIIRFLSAFHGSKWRSVVVLSASIVSWVYLTTIILSACCLFSLLCNLQCIHFEDYGKVFGGDAEAFMCLQEHVRLRYYLSKISHRFRMFLLLLFLFVTASQFVTLFETTGRYSVILNFTNSGDLIVSSVVQVVGIILCLHAAARISHRAQGIASLASRWHASASCCLTDSSQIRDTNSQVNLNASFESPLMNNYSESDLESLDNATMQTTAQLASYVSSYHKRQALVLYLQLNPGGITIFGWTIDRAFLVTLFFIEMSLVLFVLGKTIVFSVQGT